MTAVVGPDGPELKAQGGPTSELLAESGDAAPPEAQPSAFPAPSSEDSISAIVRDLTTEAPAHSGASLFSTGTAGGSSGFADTLFGATAQASFPPFDAPFSGAAAEDSAFSSPAPSPSAVEPSAPEEPIVLDGDGRPMKPMTEAEKELLASGLHLLEAPRRAPGRWRKRLVRVAIIAIILGVVGFGVAVIVPDDTREQWKAKVVEWLEPGMVIVEYLPFDLPGQESAEGSKGPIYRRAFQGLDQVKGEMNSYLEQSSENLGIAPEDKSP